MDANKIKKEMELKAYRESRKDELSKLLNGSSFQGVMRKTVAFLTDDAADHIRLSITTGDVSYTDGKSIVLGMEDYFFDPQFTRLDWVTIFKALLAHEVQHINSSNFSDIKDIRKKYTKLMAGKGIPRQLCGKIAQDMLNIMEDGRIENIIVHKLPGYKLPFLMLNSSHLAQCEFDAVADTPGQEFVDFINTSLCYVKTGRLPVGISVYAGTRFETEFKKVQSLFDLAVDARTSNDCKNLCLRVLKLTADYFADLLKQEADQATADENSGSEKNGGQEGEYTSSAENEYNNSPNGTPQEQAAADSAAGDGSAPKGRGYSRFLRAFSHHPQCSASFGVRANRPQAGERFRACVADQAFREAQYACWSRLFPRPVPCRDARPAHLHAEGPAYECRSGSISAPGQFRLHGFSGCGDGSGWTLHPSRQIYTFPYCCRSY